MLTITRISPGAGIDYLLRQIATGQHDFRPAPSGAEIAYHADPLAHGEAPGWWAGNSEQLFGVHGEVSPPQMQLLVGEGKHPETGEKLGGMWRSYVPMDDAYRKAAVEKAWANLPDDATYEQVARAWLNIWTAPERRPVAAFDVTVAPVKSVSLLWAFGDEHTRTQVMAAHHAGVRATLAHLRTHGAFTRTGAGGITQIDTDGLAAMVFDHRMSREKDPHLHSHIIVSSKVRVTTPTGTHKWMALDSKAFYQASIAARVAYERAVEGELARRLGVRFAQRDGSPVREIAGLSTRSVQHYSKRRAAIETDLHQPATAPPTGRRTLMKAWRHRAQQATLRTRPDKAAGESTDNAVNRWRTEDRAAGLATATEVRRVASGRDVDDIDRLAVRALERARRIAAKEGHPLDRGTLSSVVSSLRIEEKRQPLVIEAAIRRDPRLAVQEAIRVVSETRAVFSLDHLELALGRILHVERGTPYPRDWQRVQQLAARAVADNTAGLRVLTPPALLQWGPSLTRRADMQSIYSRHRDLKMSTEPVLAAEKDVIAYSQRRGAKAAPTPLLDAVASTVDLSAEKRAALHFAVGDDRRITGIVGPAGTGKTYLQRAVALAAQQAGVPIVGLTVGQNAAKVLAAATREDGKPGIRTENIAMWLHGQSMPPEGTTAADWTFRPGQWVIVDEASQASSYDLARLARLLEPVNGKLILVGDPAQVPAVGPGGLFRYLTSLGNTTTLHEVRRFTDRWEGPASLRLRDGDTTVLAEYDRRGRIVSGHRDHLVQQLLNGWAADILQGRTALMLVETEEQAKDLAAHARRILIRAGIVDRGRTATLADGNRASTGDTIVTRRNDRQNIVGDTFVANRDQWTVLEVTTDHGLRVRNTTTGNQTVLPSKYVGQHVQLAYAGTVDSAQGRTVDTARGLITAATSRAKLYVMATRGRLFNQLFVITSDDPDEPHQRQDPTAGIATIADILRADKTDRSATETEQELWANADSLHHWVPIYDDLTGRATMDQHVAVVRRVAGSDIAGRLADDPALPALATRLTALAAAGYNAEEVLQAAVSKRELGTANDIAAVLSWRIDQLGMDLTPDPAIATSPAQAASFTQRAPHAGGDIGAALTQVARICDQRVTALTHLAQERRPRWAQGLGPVPDDPAGQQQWRARAAAVVAYRDRYRVTGDEPIGPEPSGRDPVRWGAWHRARLTLGVSTLVGRLDAASNTELRGLVAAQRAADAAAPEYVGGKLRTAHLALMTAEQTVRELRLDLTTATATAGDAERLAAARTPRWWHAGPLRTRAVHHHTTARQDAVRATHRVDDLQTRLAAAITTASGALKTVSQRETQHATWTAWYTAALPTRYAGLAAAAEQARRAQRLATGIKELAADVRSTTDRVRAVDATRPQPHHNPPAEHLEADARTAHDRLTDPDWNDPNDQPDTSDPSIDLDA